jgi:hypothetical protein
LQDCVIDTTKITPLDRRLLGQAGFEAMKRFYSDPNNLRRFVEWQKSRGITVDKTKIYNPLNLKF